MPQAAKADNIGQSKWFVSSSGIRFIAEQSSKKGTIFALEVDIIR